MPIKPPPMVSRRSLLKVALAGGAGLALATGCDSGDDRRATTPRDRRSTASAGAPASISWAGHQAGRIYLGASTFGMTVAELEKAVGTLGVHRTFHGWWSLRAEQQVIADDQANGRLPWVSFKPARRGRGGWAEVASGERDEDLRARGRMYAGFDRPVVVTFHHEPGNDEHIGTPAEFAAAFGRVHQVMAAETGLRNVVFVPILGDWDFNPANRHGRARAYLTDEVLARSAFVGIDLYQRPGVGTYAARLGRVLDLLATWGRPDLMIGLGETACTNEYGGDAAAWWAEGWEWAVGNADKVGVISYFNSQRNSRPGVYWPLDESATKLAAFRDSMRSPVSCRLG